MKYLTMGVAAGALSLVSVLGCGQSTQPDADDSTYQGTGGTAGGAGSEAGGASSGGTGGTGATDEVNVFDCEDAGGSIPSGPTVYVDENGYFRTGPNDPGGYRCEGGDLVFYDEASTNMPYLFIRTQEEMARVAEAIETTGCGTIVGRVLINCGESFCDLTNLNGLSGLEHVRYGSLTTRTGTVLQDTSALLSVGSVDGTVGFLGATVEEGLNPTVRSHLLAVGNQETYGNALFDCPVQPLPDGAEQFALDQVYVIGGLSSEYRYANDRIPADAGGIMNVNDHSDLRAGIPQTEWMRLAAIRGSTGRLVYSYYNQVNGTFGTYEFEPEPFAMSAVRTLDYPADPTQNDTSLTLACRVPDRMFVHPDDGSLIVGCADVDSSTTCPPEGGSCNYFTESGTPYPVPVNHALAHIGIGGYLLLQGYDYGPVAVHRPMGIVPSAVNPDIPSGVTAGLRPVVAAARAVDDGFLVAFIYEGGGELWHVDFAGTATSEGEYPGPPSVVSSFGGRTPECALDGQSRLYCMGTVERVHMYAYQIVSRHELGAASAEIVYSEIQNVLGRPSKLATGP
jgi:hypothetical protein